MHEDEGQAVTLGRANLGRTVTSLQHGGFYIPFQLLFILVLLLTGLL